MSVIAGEFDGDGLLDLVVLDRGSDRICILRGLPGGGFANPTIASSFQTGLDPIKVATGRFSHDGYEDLAILNEKSQDVTILRNDGSGHFVPGQSIPVGDRATDLISQDINQDGIADLMVSNEAGDLLVLIGAGDGTFAPYQRAGEYVTLAAGDLNGDGQPDFVLTNQAQDQLLVQNSGTGQGFLQGRAQGLLAPSDVKIADLNGDGIPDLVVANSNGNDLLIYLGTGGGRFDPPLQVFTGTSPVGITLASFDGDGLPDLIVTNSGSNDVSILLTKVDATGFHIKLGPAPAGGQLPRIDHGRRFRG